LLDKAVSLGWLTALGAVGLTSSAEGPAAFHNLAGPPPWRAERFGKVEAWIDGVRVGSYADFREAKEAVLKIRLQPRN